MRAAKLCSKDSLAASGNPINPIDLDGSRAQLSGSNSSKSNSRADCRPKNAWPSALASSSAGRVWLNDSLRTDDSLRPISHERRWRRLWRHLSRRFQVVSPFSFCQTLSPLSCARLNWLVTTATAMATVTTMGAGGFSSSAGHLSPSECRQLPALVRYIGHCCATRPGRLPLASRSVS